MSKAEEKAWEWSIKNKLDPYSMGRAYGEGYQQAEKDLELAVGDIKTIDRLLNQCVDCNNPYQEVLERFNKLKEK